MAASRSIEQRLDEVESRSAIADLVHTYALHIRYGQLSPVSANGTDLRL